MFTNVESRWLTVLLAFVLVTISQRPTSLIAADQADDQSIIHVLSRLSFGPQPGDIERVKAIGGISAYIEEQLHPEHIADTGVTLMLKDYGALEMNLEQLIEAYPPVSRNAGRRRATIFEKRAHVQHKSEESEEKKGPSQSDARFRRMAMEDRQKDYQIIGAKLIRAVYSERQLQEMMVDFWMNHFNIPFGDNPFAAHFEQQVIRPHTMGNFEDLLMAVAHHPSMLTYLDNWLSSAPADVIQQRLAELKPTLNDDEYLALMARMPFLEKAKGLNENYARELMELHTVGIDGGYNQQDIIEVAKVLTGWTIVTAGNVSGSQFSSNSRDDEGVFTFDPLMHIEGDKKVLGETIKSGGVKEGEQVLHMLAHHFSTARFISTKLVRRFVADDPPAEMVEAASETFEQTDGDIREVLRTIFNSPQFLSSEFHQAKIKKPLEFVVSALRAVNAQVDNTNGRETLANLLIGDRRRSFTAQMGELIYNFETPDGNPDVAAAWINTNSLLKRMEFVSSLVSNQFQVSGRRGGSSVREIPGLRTDLASAEALLKQLGIPRPTAEQIAQNQEQVKKAIAKKAAEMKTKARPAAVRRGRGGGPPPKVPSAQAMTVSTMLGSPHFQKR